MQSDALAACIAGSTAEENRRRQQAGLDRTLFDKELREASPTLEELYDVISQGLRTKGLKDRPLGLEQGKKDTEEKLAALPPSHLWRHNSHRLDRRGHT